MLRTRISGFAYAGGLAACILAWPLAVQLFGSQRLRTSAQQHNVWKADLASYVTGSQLLRLSPSNAYAEVGRFHIGYSEAGAFLGWPLIVLCLVAIVLLRRDRRVIAAASFTAVFFVLSLGATLQIGGRNAGIPLPFRVIESIPLLENILATRLSFLVDLGIATLLALIVERARAVRGAIAAATPVAIAGCGSLLVPHAMSTVGPVEVPTFFTSSAVHRAIPHNATVLLLPFPDGNHTAGQLWSAMSDIWFAFPGGYFLAPTADGRTGFGAIEERTQALFAAIEDGGAPPAIDKTIRDQARRDFTHWGVDRVALGPDKSSPALAAWMTELLCAAPERIDDIELWPSAAVPPSCGNAS